MRRRVFTRWVCVALLVAPAWLVAAPATDSEIQRVSAKTLAKEKFIFPDDLNASQLNVVFLGISDSQEDGQRQTDELLALDLQLNERGLLTPDVVAWHFPVMEGVPFFVKGLISGGMRDVYKGKVPLQQVAILHVKNADEFTASIGVANIQKPAVLLISNSGAVLGRYQGNAGEIDIESLAAAIAEATAVPPAE